MKKIKEISITIHEGEVEDEHTFPLNFSELADEDYIWRGIREVDGLKIPYTVRIPSEMLEDFNYARKTKKRASTKKK